MIWCHNRHPDSVKIFSFALKFVIFLWLWNALLFITFHIYISDSMEHVCSSCSIEILGDFTQTCKGVFSVSFLLVLLLLGAIFDPVTNFTAISASIFVHIFGFGVFSWNSFGGALVKFSTSGLSSETSTTSSSAGLVGRLLVPCGSSALEPSSSASTFASSRGLQSGFVGFLGEIHFVQTFCQLVQHSGDVRRAFLLYLLEWTCF